MNDAADCNGRFKRTSPAIESFYISTSDRCGRNDVP